jgi:gluconate kinase
VFVQLSGSFAEIRQRLTARRGHMMAAGLPRSRFDRLEPLVRDENRRVGDVGSAGQ